jgi:hypothetical protein
MPNGMPISRRERTAKTVKMHAISRAKRSAAGAGSARWPVVPICRPHVCTTSARNHVAQRAFNRTTFSTRSRCPERALPTTSHRTTPAERARARRKGHDRRLPRRRVVHEKRECRPRSPAAERPGFSGDAPVDRGGSRAKSWFQNRHDLARRFAASAATHR